VHLKIERCHRRREKDNRYGQYTRERVIGKLADAANRTDP
jgi:hypothetical protein